MKFPGISEDSIKGIFEKFSNYRIYKTEFDFDLRREADPELFVYLLSMAQFDLGMAQMFISRLGKMYLFDYTKSPLTDHTMFHPDNVIAEDPYIWFYDGTTKQISGEDIQFKLEPPYEGAIMLTAGVTLQGPSMFP